MIVFTADYRHYSFTAFSLQTSAGTEESKKVDTSMRSFSSVLRLNFAVLTTSAQLYTVA